MLLLTLIQDVQDGVVEAVTKISPYDATAYGGLVLVLLIFLYIMYKDKQKQADSLEKITDVLRDIEVQMHSISDLKTMVMARLLNLKPPPNTDV
jgi:hypothetical protein